MRPAEIIPVSGDQVVHLLVGRKGVAHFLKLAGRTENPFAIQHRGYLFEAEGITLYIQRGLDGFDT